jgi:hypothetical protein
MTWNTAKNINFLRTVDMLEERSVEGMKIGDWNSNIYETQSLYHATHWQAPLPTAVSVWRDTTEQMQSCQAPKVRPRNAKV